MSDLAKLARKAKKEKVRGHEITIMPLGLSDMDLFENKKQTISEGLETTKEIIKKSIPNSTDDEISNMSIEYMRDLQKAIMKVNNIEESKAKEMASILGEIKADQDAKSA